ncbi:hypothetical protein CAC42_7599 [Sphaceloma murrayae]|uniref:Uncharacterized protein n=1 Tax=Sphaceloma murrayae TaxID=2082308 RepID=A0A2K1QTG1_9PEZI|nr:hypothetical protein CAC42_7599 [Sphaceloma murrayae]
MLHRTHAVRLNLQIFSQRHPRAFNSSGHCPTTPRVGFPPRKDKRPLQIKTTTPQRDVLQNDSGIMSTRSRPWRRHKYDPDYVPGGPIPGVTQPPIPSVRDRRPTGYPGRIYPLGLPNEGMDGMPRPQNLPSDSEHTGKPSPFRRVSKLFRKRSTSYLITSSSSEREDPAVSEDAGISMEDRAQREPLLPPAERSHTPDALDTVKEHTAQSSSSDADVSVQSSEGNLSIPTPSPRFSPRRPSESASLRDQHSENVNQPFGVTKSMSQATDQPKTSSKSSSIARPHRESLSTDPLPSPSSGVERMPDLIESFSETLNEHQEGHPPKFSHKGLPPIDTTASERKRSSIPISPKTTANPPASLPGILKKTSTVDTSEARNASTRRAEASSSAGHSRHDSQFSNHAHKSSNGGQTPHVRIAEPTKPNRTTEEHQRVIESIAQQVRAEKIRLSKHGRRRSLEAVKAADEEKDLELADEIDRRMYLAKKEKWDANQAHRRHPSTTRIDDVVLSEADRKRVDRVARKTIERKRTVDKRKKEEDVKAEAKAAKKREKQFQKDELKISTRMAEAAPADVTGESGPGPATLQSRRISRISEAVKAVSSGLNDAYKALSTKSHTYKNPSYVGKGKGREGESTPDHKFTTTRPDGTPYRRSSFVESVTSTGEGRAPPRASAQREGEWASCSSRRSSYSASGRGRDSSRTPSRRSHGQLRAVESEASSAPSVPPLPPMPSGNDSGPLFKRQAPLPFKTDDQITPIGPPTAPATGPNVPAIDAPESEIPISPGPPFQDPSPDDIRTDSGSSNPRFEEEEVLPSVEQETTTESPEPSRPGRDELYNQLGDLASSPPPPVNTAASHSSAGQDVDTIEDVGRVEELPISVRGTIAQRWTKLITKDIAERRIKQKCRKNKAKESKLEQVAVRRHREEMFRRYRIAMGQRNTDNLYSWMHWAVNGMFRAVNLPEREFSDPRMRNGYEAWRKRERAIERWEQYMELEKAQVDADIAQNERERQAEEAKKDEVKQATKAQKHSAKEEKKARRRLEKREKSLNPSRNDSILASASRRIPHILRPRLRRTASTSDEKTAIPEVRVTSPSTVADQTGQQTDRVTSPPGSPQAANKDDPPKQIDGSVASDDSYRSRSWSPLSEL